MMAPYLQRLKIELNCHVMTFVYAVCLYRYSSITAVLKFMVLFKVDGDGDCMFAAILKQIAFQEEIQKFIFTPLYLRRMLAVHYMKYKDENDKELFYAVRKSLFVYGLPQEDTETVSPGPFSIKEYFEHIIQDKAWGDVTCLLLMVSMWSCRISVLNSTSLGEMRVRHNMEMGLTDIALVFNNCDQQGHFSALMRCNKDLLIGGKVGKGPGYILQDDIKKRLLEGKYGGREMMLNFKLKYVVISESKMKKIVESKKALGSIKELIKKVEDDGGVLEGVNVEEKKKKEQKVSKLVHEEEDIQEYHTGDTKCVKCDKEFPTSTQLQRHLDRYHRYLFSFTCEICKKGLTTKQGMNEHMLQHMNSDEESTVSYLCPNCGKSFKLKRSRNQHVKQQHEDYSPMNCQFGCGRVCYVKKNIPAHEKACKKNPHRKVYKCPICGEEKWYSEGQLERSHNLDRSFRIFI